MPLSSEEAEVHYGDVFVHPELPLLLRRKLLKLGALASKMCGKLLVHKLDVRVKCSVDFQCVYILW